jgi:hypothetical protein
MIVFLFSCKKEKIIAGHKIININFTNAKTGQPVDSIGCQIIRPQFVSYSMITYGQSDKNGNCRLEIDFKSTDKFNFLVSEISSFNGNKVFTSRGLYNSPSEVFRVKGNRPYVDFGKKNMFDLKIQLIPLIKIKIISEFAKDFNGYPTFEVFENNESIYSFGSGGWLRKANERDTTDCYISSIDDTKLVYSFISTPNGQTIFSKSLLIVPDLMTNNKIYLIFN